MSTRVSIALATYNGAKFLPEQLASYAEQTQLPDELVVCDDDSTDASLEVLQEFAQQAPFVVHIHQNKTRLGIVGNFAKAVALCRGNVIFFSDQDDIWLPHKVERILGVFDSTPSIGAVFSDAEVVNASRESFGNTVWKAARFSQREQARLMDGQAFEVMLKGDYVYGCTFAFRSYYRQYIVPFPEDSFHHDLWTARLIAALGEIGIVEEPLMQFRRHGNNSSRSGVTPHSISTRMEQLAISAPPVTIERRYTKRVRKLQRLKERLTEYLPPQSKELQYLDDHIAFQEWRSRLPSSRLRRFMNCLRGLAGARYHLHAQGFITFAKDLLQRDK